MRRLKVLSRLITCTVTGFMVMATVQSAGAQTATPNAASVSSRLQNVKRLIEHSSGAKQVEASANPAAVQLREKARSLYAQAEQSYEAQQYQDADYLLTEATQVMFDSVRVAGRTDSVLQKKKKDFENLYESINSLKQALARVADEKGMPEHAAKVTETVEPILTEARELARSGNFEAARYKLNEAYQVVKSTLILLRDGDTLIKSTTFANKTEEYQYEHTRNETLVSLLQVMAGEKFSASELERVVSHAAGERTAAARLADQGDLDGAINLLDLSSRGIARELGRVGIFIPM